MTHFRIFFFYLLFTFACFASLKAQELSIGDSLPDYIFHSVFRYAQPSVQLSNFAGKVLILDLWRTTCSHCMSSFTHFDSLTKAYPGRVVALAITSETRETIRQFLAGNGYIRDTKLPVITDDTVLAGNRFPFIYIPHVVLVDSTGRIAAITAPENITKVVIGDLLTGKRINLPLKKEITDFNYDTLVVAEGKGRNLPSLAYASAITHGLPGVLQLNDIDSSGGRIFYKAYNMTIPDLYAQAYHFFLTPNRLILKVRDSTRFFVSSPGDSSNQSEKLWVYNLILPKPNAHPENYAIQDFDRFFGTRGYVEKRQVSCLVLVRTGTRTRWRSTGREGYYTDSAGLMLIHNITISNICASWNMSFPLPVINETGLDNEQADMVLQGSPTDLLSLRQNLHRYDFDMIPATREIEVLVVEDRKK